jgi:hypothetical protein
MRRYKPDYDSKQFSAPDNPISNIISDDTLRSKRSPRSVLITLRVMILPLAERQE